MAQSDIETPLVSVLMPAKNAEKFLNESVDSILNQTLNEFELIAIDDNSEDATGKILKDYQNSDSRVRVVKCNGNGIADALNFGVNHVRSPLIARMDADDVAREDRLKLQLEAFENNQNLVLLGSYYYVFEDVISNTVSMITPPVDNEKLKYSIQSFPTFGHPTIMMKTDAIRKVGGYRKFFEGAEDHDLYLRLSELGELEVVPEFLLHYRSHTAQFSREKQTKGVLASVAAVYCFQRARENFKVYGNPDGSSSELVNEFLEYSSEAQTTMSKHRVHLCVRAIKSLGMLPEYLEKLLRIRTKIVIKLIKSLKFKLAYKFWMATRKAEWLDQ